MAGGTTDAGAKLQGYIDKSINYDKVITNLGESIEAQEANLQKIMEKLKSSKNPNPAALASMQYQMNKWSLNFNMYSSVIKSIKDITTSLIQKM